MTAEQETHIANLIESLELDEYEVDNVFAGHGFLGFIFPEDIEAVNEAQSDEIIDDLQGRFLE